MQGMKARPSLATPALHKRSRPRATEWTEWQQTTWKQCKAPSSVLAPFVAMPFVPSSFLFLVAMLGAPSSVLAPTPPRERAREKVLVDFFANLNSNYT